MNRVSKTLAVGILTGAVLVTGTARAETATTVTTSSTTTSTSTTLLPHPFSPDTRACIKDARQAYKQCAGTTDDCTKAFQASYAKCFAGSAGEKCASKCLTNESKCVTAVPTTKKSCRKTCRTTRKNDIRACRRIPDGENIWAAGDQGCLTTARLTFSTCKWQCSGAKDVCHTNFRFCIADCPNQ